MAETQLLKGLPLAQAIRTDIAARVAACRGRGVEPLLATVVATADPAVAAYAEAKRKLADRLGIAMRTVVVDPAAGQAALEDAVAGLSADPAVHGIMLEVPVDAPLDAEGAIRRIDPGKDVDGLTPTNLGLIAAGREAEALAPATPLSCIRLALSVTTLAGRTCTVVGRGRAVGRSLAPMLVNRDATVTICHSRTRDLAGAVREAEIVFLAAGRPGLLTPDMVRAGQIVVDAGTTVVGDRLVGDADPTLAGLVAAITPVPGGVGTLTTTLLFDNLLRAIDLRQSEV